jgi:hypothetical protein
MRSALAVAENLIHSVHTQLAERELQGKPEAFFGLGAHRSTEH